MSGGLVKFHSPIVDAKLAECRKILNSVIIPTIEDIYAEMSDEEFSWVEPYCFYDWDNDAGSGWRYIMKGCPRVNCCRD